MNPYKIEKGFADEKVKPVFYICSLNFNIISADFFLNRKSQRLQNGNEHAYYISSQRGDCFSAQCKRAITEIVKCPADKGYGHTKRFARAHGTVTNDSVFVLKTAFVTPPAEGQKLLL